MACLDPIIREEDHLQVVNVVHQLGCIARRVVPEHQLEQDPAANDLSVVERSSDGQP